MHMGRATTRKIVLDAVYKEILDYSEQRVAAIISVLGSGTAYISFSNPNEFGLRPNEGHALTSTNTPLRLDALLGVRAIHGPVYGAGSVAGVTLIVTEIYVDKGCRERIDEASRLGGSYA